MYHDLTLKQMYINGTKTVKKCNKSKVCPSFYNSVNCELDVHYNKPNTENTVSTLSRSWANSRELSSQKLPHQKKKFVDYSIMVDYTGLHFFFLEKLSQFGKNNIPASKAKRAHMV